jgi:predicted phosphodiesterase
MRRTIVIGDVHGCVVELEDLLKAVEHQRDDDVVFVGDLVAKGPDSQGVVQLAREIGARGVRGNHDHHVLSWRRRTLAGDDELAPLRPHHQQVADTLKEADWRYIEGLPLILRLPEHRAIVVHGGFAPGVPLSDQKAEHLLNLRSITPDGRPSKRVSAGEPWAKSWNGPEEALFGHDAVRGLQQYRYATGLDTGCVYGRELTALLLPEHRLVHVPARRVYSEAKPKA